MIDAAYDTAEAYSDPLEADTDGDGIDDATELESAGDPTLYDVRPPEIDVQNSGYHIPEMSLDTTYWVSLRIHDPAGVDRAALVKAGNEETTANYDGGETVYDSLEFTERLAESDTDVDTSSYKSTFLSFGGKVVETAGSVGESVGDTTAGTTIYVETRDRNGNEDDAVGVGRANFYGEAAGSLYTGTPADYIVASEFATVSGFSASLGVAFQDISQLIDDPEAVVEGIRALLDLAQSEGLGAAETLVKAMAQDIERKQAVNNPYGSLEERTIGICTRRSGRTGTRGTPRVSSRRRPSAVQPRVARKRRSRAQTPLRTSARNSPIRRH